MAKKFQQAAVSEVVADGSEAPQDAFPENEQPTGTVEEIPPEDPEIPASKADIAKTVEEQVAEAIARLTITHQDVVIAVMGLTGVGKSRFISYLTSNDIKIGHGMKSCTAEVAIFPCSYKDGRTIYLVDTPGFNDTKKSDAQILEYVSVFFSALYSKNIMLAGLIYLHRISDNRMEGSSLLNLEVFQKLCGKEALHNVVLATTMWDTILTVEAVQETEDREQELMIDFWADMLHEGSKVFRQDDGLRSAMRIIDYLMSLDGHGVVTEIARELIDKKLTHKQTKAGKVVQKELLDAEERFTKKMADVERRHARAIKEGNEETARKLKKQKDELDAQKQTHKVDMEIMGRSFKESQEELEKQVEELTTKNEKAAEKAKNDEKELTKLKEREVERDKALKLLREKTTKSEADWKTKMDGLEAEQKRTNAEYEARLNALAVQEESSISKRGILGVGTMVLGAITLQPGIVVAGAAMTGSGGLSMARRASKKR